MHLDLLKTSFKTLTQQNTNHTIFFASFWVNYFQFLYVRRYILAVTNFNKLHQSVTYLSPEAIIEIHNQL